MQDHPHTAAGIEARREARRPSACEVKRFEVAQRPAYLPLPATRALNFKRSAQRIYFGPAEGGGDCAARGTAAFNLRLARMLRIPRDELCGEVEHDHTHITLRLPRGLILRATF